MAIFSLNNFFAHCLGNWSIERTYHYISEGRSERSHTHYCVTPLDQAGRQKVLADNQQPDPTGLVGGFHLAFETTSDQGVQVSMALNILFIPTAQVDSLTEGLYLRDRAYEEDRPITSHFRYDPDQGEMLMTTPYARVVSVDSIRFINPHFRLRQIINYRRAVEPLTEPLLVGFGIEQRV